MISSVFSYAELALEDLNQALTQGTAVFGAMQGFSKLQPKEQAVLPLLRRTVSLRLPSAGVKAMCPRTKLLGSRFAQVTRCVEHVLQGLIIALMKHP